MYYMFRFNEPGNVEAVQKYLQENNVKVFLVQEYKNYEDKTGSHYHMKVEFHQKDGMIRKLFNRWGFSGNKSWSFKEWIDGSNGERYLCKGEARGKGPNVILNNVYENEEITKFHNDYWDHNDSLKSEGSVDGSRKKRKVTTFQETVVRSGKLLKMTDNDYSNRHLISAHVVDSYAGLQDRGMKRRQMREVYEQLLILHSVDSGTGKTMRTQMIDDLIMSANDNRF